jgi:hypothetical protein
MAISPSQTIPGGYALPVDSEVMFSSHKNAYSMGMEKRQTRLMRLVSFITPFLKEDEKILLITTGCSPLSVMEQLTAGWIVFYLKRSLFVFTDRRMFHVPTRPNYSYRDSVAQVLYADCQSIKVKGGSLLLCYKNGGKEKFPYMARRERKKIRALLEAIPLGGKGGGGGGRTHLCPRCAGELERDRYVCPKCKLEFIDRAGAKRASLLYPGGGYFHTRHPFLGLGDALTEISLAILVCASVIGLLQGSDGSVLALAFFGAVLAFEKAVSVFHADHFVREYIPREKKVKPRQQ